MNPVQESCPLPKTIQSPSLLSAEAMMHDLKLGDPRRHQRAQQIMKACLLKPGKRFCQCFASRHQVKGAYRFIDNDFIDPMQLSQSVWNASARECAELTTIYAIQDSTDLDFSQRRNSLVGADPLGKKAPWGYGFYLHTVLAVRRDGLPWGILHHHLIGMSWIEGYAGCFLGKGR